ncbi:MAG: biotin/lipoyl-binding protein, partial [Pseudomonas sp.]|nr:biotin/lipoyl-binding protein [Pseudomonas sp.]
MSAHKKPSRLFVLPLLIALLAAGAFGYWKSLQDRLPEGVYEANGRLEATEVQVATKYPGRLAEVLVAEGDSVTVGQLLARIDTRTLEAQRSQAESEVLRARENVAA